MGSIQSEYHRFLNQLGQRHGDEDIRRFANLVYANLPHLAEVGSARRARSVRLAPIAIMHLAQTGVESNVDAVNQMPDHQFGRLHQLHVGPFRGFMRQEVFDLSHDITLVYGANGTGKSSFCEALETSMLGSISEAQIKRVDYQLYCNNARLRRHVTPELTTRDVAGLIARFPTSENEFRFCFIEKNRLDAFARIAAKTPGDQRQLIATLFGVDQFSEFVRGFNPSLDENLALVGPKAQELAQRRVQLATSEHVIRSYPDKLVQFQDAELALAQRIWPGWTFQAFCEWLLGTPDQVGRLPYLVAQLEAVPPAIYDIAPARLTTMLDEARRLQGLWNTASTALAARSGEVSYAQLYRAVLELAAGATACPACGTPLDVVARSPFDKARAGLAQLAELAVIQESEVGYRNQLNESVRVLWEEMKRTVAIAAIAFPDQFQAARLPALPQAAHGNWLAAWFEHDAQPWNALMAISALIEGADTQARAAHAQRGAFAEERARLDGNRLEVERLRTIRSAAHTELIQAQQTVALFGEANRELVAEVAAEVAVTAHHQRVKVAYDGFLRLLQDYLTSLPALLLQGLGELAKDLFNAFNRSDPPNDLLHALWLPLAENGKIEVEFVGEPGTRYDALVLLSEGHIKCLGLAILLAKNISQNCPVVIFDDVVNAIDDEHRDGIWRTFFEDGRLDNKQIILTSHAEEFLHRIQQELGAQRAGAIRRYKFLPHLGGHDLRVDADPPTKNYVLLSQQALATEEKRDALRYARPALESVTDRLWTWLGNHGDGRLEIKLGGPRSPWELNNKCSKLRSAFGRIVVGNAAAQGVVDAMDRVLGVGSGSIEWGCLNSGVHDSQREHEFDRAAVQVVVESVVALDAALAVLQRR